MGKNHPKLRSKAGECRGLVPFGLEVAEEVLGDGPEENAAKTAARFLRECYNNLSRETFDKENLQRNCDLFSLQLPRKRFQADASDLFLSNTISAKRFARLLANAKVSGASVDRTFKEDSRNVVRDLRRKMRKNKPWPRVYLASVPCRSCKTGQLETMKVPMWLPHELIHMLSETTDPARLLLRERCSPQILEHLTMVEKNMSFQAGSVIPLSLWMDGVPFNNNRSKSIELCSLALIGQGSDVRLPIFMILKDFVASDITIKALFDIVRWSFEQLMCCKMPSTRHDGSPFLSSDCRRARLAGSDIPPAALCQVRGDWMCYKQHFDLAGCLAAFF